MKDRLWLKAGVGLAVNVAYAALVCWWLTACQPTPPPHIHCRPVSGQTECRPMP